MLRPNSENSARRGTSPQPKNEINFRDEHLSLSKTTSIMETEKALKYIRQEVGREDTIFADNTIKYGRFIKYFLYLVFFILLIGPITMVGILIFEKNPDAIFFNLHLWRKSFKCVNNLALAIVNMFILYTYPELIPQIFFIYPIIMLYIVNLASPVLFMTDRELRSFKTYQLPKRHAAAHEGCYFESPSEEASRLQRIKIIEEELSNCLKLCLIDSRSFDFLLYCPFSMKNKQSNTMKKLLYESTPTRIRGLEVYSINCLHLFKQIVLSEVIERPTMISRKGIIVLLLAFVYILSACGFSVYTVIVFLDVSWDRRFPKYVAKFIAILFKVLLAWVGAVRLLIFKHIFYTVLEKLNIFEQISNLVNITKPKLAKLVFTDRKSLNSYMSLLSLQFSFCKRDIQEIELMMGCLTVASVFNLIMFYADSFGFIKIDIGVYRSFFHLAVFADIGTFLIFIVAAVMTTSAYNTNYSKIRQSFEKVRRVLLDLEINSATYTLCKTIQSLESSDLSGDETRPLNQEEVLASELYYSNFSQGTASSDERETKGNENFEEEVAAFGGEFYHYIISNLVRYYLSKDAGPRELSEKIQQLLLDFNQMIEEIESQKLTHCFKFFWIPLRYQSAFKILAFSLTLSADLLRRTLTQFLTLS